MRIFQLGYPGGMGGANTECWHTVKLWRSMGWDVSLIPTWVPDLAWKPKLDSIGVETIRVRRVSLDPSNPDPELAALPTLAEVPGLAGSVVVGMCNRLAISALDELRAIGCRLIWVNCMTYWSEWESRAWYDHGPPEMCVFQSHFQRSQLEKRLRIFKYDPACSRIIRGAFDVDGWDFSPRPYDPHAFVVGKLARPDPQKWPGELWTLLAAVPLAERRALCMGWNEEIAQKCGMPPDWAECLPPQTIGVEEFMGRCHALFCANGGARENWPRVALEAMASGVPVVAPKLWGWPEMIETGVSGVLCETHADMAFALAKLGREKAYREEMIEAGRERLWKIADPAKIGEAWRECFEFAERQPVSRPRLQI